MFYLAKSLDPTRLVEDNSAYLYDHVTTDLNTWHFYIGDYDRARRHVQNVVEQSYEGSPYHYVGGVYADVAGAEAYRQGTQPLLNSEYAGISAWGGDRDISYSFKFLTSELRRHDMICGYVYTELTDVEWEHNGLPQLRPHPQGVRLRPLRAGDDRGRPQRGGLRGPGLPPLPDPASRGASSAPPPSSPTGTPRPIEGGTLRWRLTAVDRFGHSRPAGEGQLPVEPHPYSVTVFPPLEATLPTEISLVTIAFWVEDGEGTVRARNYVNVDVFATRLETQDEALPSSRVLRIVPGDYIGSSWLDPRIGPRGSKFGGPGAGWVDYAVGLPDDLNLLDLRRLRLRFEAGARTAQHRLDWRDTRHLQLGDYPQTEEHQLPSDVVVWVNGVQVGAVHLPDDPADSRGVLSLHNSDYFEPGSYGFLTDLEAGGDLLRHIVENTQGGRLIVRFEVPAGGLAGGLNLYGSRMGAYPVAPTVFLDL